MKIDIPIGMKIRAMLSTMEKNLNTAYLKHNHSKIGISLQPIKIRHHVGSRVMNLFTACETVTKPSANFR